METSPNCPQCESKGRKVSAVTLESLLRPVARETLTDTPFRFCRTTDCDVVYFSEDQNIIFATADLTVIVFQKSTDPNRLVCHCFEHTVASITSDIEQNGHSDVADSIGEKCKEGLDDCERNNPQGACCLANVRKVMKDARTTSGCGSETDVPSDNCCSAEET